jgi:hypothetical protein
MKLLNRLLARSFHKQLFARVDPIMRGDVPTASTRNTGRLSLTNYVVPVEFIERIMADEIKYFAFFAATFTSCLYYGGISHNFDLEDTAAKALGELALETSVCFVIPSIIKSDVIQFDFSRLKIPFPKKGGGVFESLPLTLQVSLTRKRALRASLGGRELKFTEAYPLVFYAQSFPEHGKTHAQSNYGVDPCKLVPERIDDKESFAHMYTVFKNAAGAYRAGTRIDKILGKPFKNLGTDIIEPNFLPDCWLSTLKKLRPYSIYANILVNEWNVLKHVSPNPLGNFFMTRIHSMDHCHLTEIIVSNSPHRKMVVSFVPKTRSLDDFGISKHRLVLINMLSVTFGVSFPKNGVQIVDTLPPFSKAISNSVAD